MATGRAVSTIDSVFSPSLQEFLKSSGGGRLGNVDPALLELVVAGSFHFGTGAVIWVVGENEDLIEKETRLRGWLDFLGDGEGAIFFYTRPFEDPFVNTNVDPSSLGHKLKLVGEHRPGGKAIVVTTWSALSIRIENPVDWPGFFLRVARGEEMSRRDFITRATDMGYRSTDFVEIPGEISWRGSIVDVFPKVSETPVRIEFSGDSVSSIRAFDSHTQKSLRILENVSIPRSGFFLNLDPAQNYLKGEGGDMLHLPDVIGDHCLWMSDVPSARKKGASSPLRFLKKASASVATYSACLFFERTSSYPSHRGSRHSCCKPKRWVE